MNRLFTVPSTRKRCSFHKRVLSARSHGSLAWIQWLACSEKNTKVKGEITSMLAHSSLYTTAPAAALYTTAPAGAMYMTGPSQAIAPSAKHQCSVVR